MANVFDILYKLFNRKTIIKRLSGNRIKVVDIDLTQSYSRGSRRGRYNWMRRRNTISTGWSGGYTAPEVEAMRIALYDDYDVMDSDGIIASVLDIYADEVCARDSNGELLTIHTDDVKMKKILYNLFYDILNIDINLWPWVRSLCKYGDYLLYIIIDDDHGVIDVMPLHPVTWEREEGFDDSNLEAYRFKFTGRNTGYFTGEYLQSFETAHFRLLTDTNYLPYGRSIIEPARKEYKKLVLLEDAMLLQRIMRAPERRVFKIDIGNIAPEEVDSFMEDFINSTKKVPYIDEATGEYNLKFNLMNMLEDIYIPVRGGDSGTSIDTLPGLHNENQIQDIEYIKSKILAALKIPKLWIGYDENVQGKATLAAEDIRFARTVERIQNFVVSELYKIAIIHLYIQGYRGDDLLSFSLSMANPSAIYKRQQIDLLNEKMNLATNMMDSELFSHKYIYEVIFDMTEEEWKEEQDMVIEWLREKFRHSQITSEGNDPKITKKSFGTPHDLLALQVASRETGDMGKRLYPDKSDDLRHDNPGRPKRYGSFGRDNDKAFGRDPDGRKSYERSAFNNLVASVMRSFDKNGVIDKSLRSDDNNEDEIDMLQERRLMDDDEIDNLFNE